jgi:hypothetical protein
MKQSERMTSQSQKRQVDLSQQTSHDAEPFRIEWFSANGFASPTILINCIALIAFLAMQISMYPRTLRTFVLLRGFVCSRPVSLAVPPKSEQGESKPRRWLGPLE